MTNTPILFDSICAGLGRWATTISKVQMERTQQSIVVNQQQFRDVQGGLQLENQKLKAMLQQQAQE